MKLLVVEDDRTVGQYVKRGLEEAAVCRRLGGDGTEALQVIGNGRTTWCCSISACPG
jgi:DNA-binding response OmpR family regulator